MHEVPPRHEPVKYLPQRLYEFSRRYSALLQTAAPDPSLGLTTLLQELSRLLHGIFDFNFISYSLADSSLNLLQLHILDTNGALEKPIELAIDNSAAGWVWSAMGSSRGGGLGGRAPARNRGWFPRPC